MSAERQRYLDASAIVKLIVREPESEALEHWLSGGRQEIVSCALVRAEVVRAAAPRGPEAIRRARRLLDRLDLIVLDDQPLDLAGELVEPLRSPPVTEVVAVGARSSDPGHEPEHAAHLRARLADGCELDVELGPGGRQPAGCVVQPSRRSLFVRHLAFDLERHRADAIHLGGECRAASLHVTVELEAADDGVRDPADNRDEEHTKSDPEHHGPNANRDHRPNGTVLQCAPRRGVEQSGSSPGS
jgi:predicted nucleic acid-binding protein